MNETGSGACHGVDGMDDAGNLASFNDGAKFRCRLKQPLAHGIDKSPPAPNPHEPRWRGRIDGCAGQQATALQDASQSLLRDCQAFARQRGAAAKFGSKHRHYVVDYLTSCLSCSN